MKITKAKLKQIIKEELELVLEKDVGEKVAQTAEKIKSSEKGEQAIQQALKDPKVIKTLEKLVSKLPKELTEDTMKGQSYFDMWQGDHAPTIGDTKLFTIATRSASTSYAKTSFFCANKTALDIPT